MAEKEYIDLYECRDDFYATVLDILSEDITNDRANQIIDAFDYLPTADVVPVVRCKDCIHVDNGYIGHLYCRIFNSMPVSGMDYCKWGKQKAATSEKEVPVKHGRWINENFYTHCSACGKMAIYDKYGQEFESDYCPHCGAKMDGGDLNGS